MSEYTKQIVSVLRATPFIGADYLASLAFSDFGDSACRKRHWERINYAMKKGAIKRIEQPVHGSQVIFWYYVPKKG